jgi:hypothetical protein
MCGVLGVRPHAAASGLYGRAYLHRLPVYYRREHKVQEKYCSGHGTDVTKPKEMGAGGRGRLEKGPIDGHPPTRSVVLWARPAPVWRR